MPKVPRFSTALAAAWLSFSCAVNLPSPDSLDSHADADSTMEGDADSNSGSDARSDTGSDPDGVTAVMGDSDSGSDADTPGDSEAGPEQQQVFTIEEGGIGFCRVDGAVESNHSGFSGPGFANTTNVLSAGISWQMQILHPGTATLTWRYAFSGDTPRDGALIIDGATRVDAISFESTGSWDAWEESSVIIPLTEGNYKVTLESTSSTGLPNIDNITVSGVPGTAADCPADTSSPLDPVAVYIAGDSTVCSYTDTSSSTDQAGWGQMLHENLSDRVTVHNRAIGGRTALSFHMEGRADDIIGSIQPGDFYLIQFGTNDSHPTATFEVDGVVYPRYADPDTDFKQHLLDYHIAPARDAGAIPILVTPPPRNSAYCTGGNSLAKWAQAMRELGEAEDVVVSDLNSMTVSHLIAICPAPTPEDFFFLRADGSVDGTHFQENGARIMAGFVMDGIENAGLGLAAYRL